jgi:hypothetical protein
MDLIRAQSRTRRCKKDVSFCPRLTYNVYAGQEVRARQELRVTIVLLFIDIRGRLP